MKKTILFALLLSLLPFSQMTAQKVENFGVFKHVGAGVSVGTEGIGINVASPVTNYLELSLGVNFMPGIKISGDVDIDVDRGGCAARNGEIAER